MVSFRYLYYSMIVGKWWFSEACIAVGTICKWLNSMTSVFAHAVGVYNIGYTRVCAVLYSFSSHTSRFSQ